MCRGPICKRRPSMVWIGVGNLPHRRFDEGQAAGCARVRASTEFTRNPRLPACAGAGHILDRRSRKGTHSCKPAVSDSPVPVRTAIARLPAKRGCLCDRGLPRLSKAGIVRTLQWLQVRQYWRGLRPGETRAYTVGYNSRSMMAPHASIGRVGRRNTVSQLPGWRLSIARQQSGGDARTIRLGSIKQVEQKMNQSATARALWRPSRGQ